MKELSLLLCEQVAGGNAGPLELAEDNVTKEILKKESPSFPTITAVMLEVRALTKEGDWVDIGTFFLPEMITAFERNFLFS